MKFIIFTMKGKIKMKRCLISLVSLMLVLVMMFSISSCAPAAPKVDADALFAAVVGDDDAALDVEFETLAVAPVVSEPVVDVEVADNDLVDPTPATEGLKFRIASSGEYAYVFCYVGTSPDVYIPYAYEGLPVVAIGYGVFDGSFVTSVTLPDTLVEIGDYAFRNSAIRSFNVPKSLEVIAPRAFLGAGELDTITVDAENETYTAAGNCLVKGDTVVLAGKSAVIPTDASVTAIGAYALSGRNIGEFTVPANITTLGKGVFAECEELRSVVIPDSVTAIPDLAFLRCVNLSTYNTVTPTTLNLSSTVESIGLRAFSGCKKLTSVIIPKCYTIGSYAFELCAALRTVEIGEGLYEIGTAAFKNCGMLEEIVIPNSTVILGAAAFWNCSSLKYASLGTDDTCKLNQIGGACFFNCIILRPIFIPVSVEVIGTSLFDLCKYPGNADGEPAFKIYCEAKSSQLNWAPSWASQCEVVYNSLRP